MGTRWTLTNSVTTWPKSTPLPNPPKLIAMTSLSCGEGGYTLWCKEQPGGRLQPLGQINDFLLWNLADDRTRIPIHHLNDYPVEIWIDGKLSLESAFGEHLTHA